MPRVALGAAVSEQVTKGFLGRPEETAKAVTEDGWFRTGDIGGIDADGFIYDCRRVRLSRRAA